MEFNIEGVDFNVMAGYVIVNNNIDHYFPLEKKDVKYYIYIQGATIPLQSIEDWLTYYKLMDRTDKVRMINSYFAKLNE